MAKIDDILKVLGRGYQVYQGPVESAVYRALSCAKPKRARWFVRDGRYVCLGCGRGCCWTNGGFQPVLLSQRARPGRVMLAELKIVTPEQLLAAKSLLRVDEVAYCLNVSPREVGKLIDEGRLVKHVARPIRVTAESVRGEMRRIEGWPPAAQDTF